MSAHDFFLDDAKKAVAAAVADIERQTSAEVMVAVRRVSGHYRHADWMAGTLLALGWLCVFLYHPEPFEFTYLPLELAVAWSLGALLSSQVATVRRWLSSAKLREANVKRAARAAFVDLGVSRTQARTGILVYVSMFELRVEAVADVGVDVKALGKPWAEALRKLDRAVRLDIDAERFCAALRELGPVLAEAYPRAKDDRNELGDASEEDDESAEDEAAEGDEAEEARA